ncbi:MAG TPA: flavin monoamine oxidase family protein [Euzebyales bacterium]|nr:flavin monoamine oxidase family protein [Euzebyales bacterium]
MGDEGSAQRGRVWSRRRFLQGLGVVGGAGAVVAAMEAMHLAAPARKAPFTPPGRSDFALQGRGNDTTVLVLGAGVAGLTTAYELEKAGYRCEVLEARDRPGGRTWTVRDGTVETDLDGHTQTARFAAGQYFNPGPARIPQHHTTLDYCRELGVVIEPFANVNADAYYFHEHAAGSLAGRPTRHRAARADLYGYISELLAKAIDRGALDDELTADDRDAVIEFLRAFGALDADDRYLGTDRRGYATPPGAGTQAGTPSEPFGLSDLLATGFGHHFPAELAWDQAMMMFQPVGGMDRLPHALADALRGRIRYNAEVRGITSTADGVEVVFDDGSGNGTLIEADYCVCTLPPHLLARIPTSFAPEVTSGLAAVQTVPTAKIGLHYRRRFWELDERIFGGITTTDLDIGAIWYPSSGYLGEHGVLVGAYNFLDATGTYAALEPAARQARAVEQGVKVHGRAYADDLDAGFSVVWSRTRFSEGGWVEWPDRTSGTYVALLEPQGRVYFAGDHLSYTTSWQHGAFESARRTVSALHRRVLAS